MKYTLTWKDIILDFLRIYLLFGFPIFFMVTLFVAEIFSFFSGEDRMYSWDIYTSGVIQALPMIVTIYFLLLLFIITISYPYWKNTIIGEHEIILEEDYFVWKSYRQEVKTKLNLLQSFTVTPKHIIIKFAGIQKAKIPRKWIIEGEKEFIEELNILKKSLIQTI